MFLYQRGRFKYLSAPRIYTKEGNTCLSYSANTMDNLSSTKIAPRLIRKAKQYIGRYACCPSLSVYGAPCSGQDSVLRITQDRRGRKLKVRSAACNTAIPLTEPQTRLSQSTRLLLQMRIFGALRMSTVVRGKVLGAFLIQMENRS